MACCEIEERKRGGFFLPDCIVKMRDSYFEAKKKAQEIQLNAVIPYKETIDAKSISIKRDRSKIET